MQSINVVGWGIFIISLVIILYLFYQWRISLLRDEPTLTTPNRLPLDEKTKKEKIRKKKTGKKIFKRKPFKFPNIFSKSSKIQKRLKFIRGKLRRKKKDKEHHDVFLEFALTPLKLAVEPMQKLKKAVTKQMKEKETPFQKLDRLHQEKLEKEKKRKEKIARKKEHKQTIQKLKGIVKKK